MTEIVMSQTPPILHGPSDKEKKYDRQLRLWAASGQAALESANLLLVNSGAGVTGIETLKNLILPGIGRFAIYDDAVVEEADLGVNFFLDESCLGKPRSQCMTALLTELNPDVHGSWYPNEETASSLESLLTTSPVFTAIIYALPIAGKRLAQLVAYGIQHKTPLFAIHSAGFYSYFRISLPGAFPIVDTHPDETATTDLRLLTPWPELVDFARDMTKDIDSLDAYEHGHLPYVVILLHYLEHWKQTHEGKYPSTYKEKTEFRRIVQSAARTDNPEGGEENFDEAAAAVLKTVVPPSLPSGLREVFDYTPSESIEERSSFWIVADAIKAFHAKHKVLPLRGNVPDMKANSNVYIQLQNIYKTKARQDAAEVLETAQSIAPGRQFDPAEVELFCKNAPFVKLINATKGGDSASSSSVDLLRKVTAQELANDENADMTQSPLSLLPIYLALRATSHVASATADEILSSIEETIPGAKDHERIVSAAQEVARAEGGELHNIAALTGGMVAQEMIKIITKQYIPIDNTCIFDGIASRSQVLRL
ncbi:putative NEDD8-activating enzyme E1 regulatory subunit [Podospora aff. communis PSN243]|uniref:NEDD8-activating enzyme E1 regulatory subunit n=1 Tax=Podospora aff. communis PSN243 TaxID=3040156 RepID=A0AAV9GLE7_9PEZI|nr:putative NEDD8-activating enzyme E1 regulatory subunit [Podospora aff. communis PSN243]